jgi:serine/threonine protein kinase
MTDILSLNNYKILCTLGEGGFSKVYKVKKGDNYFAIKVIDKEIIEEDPEMEHYIISEIEFMLKVKGKYLIEMKEYFEDE